MLPTCNQEMYQSKKVRTFAAIRIPQQPPPTRTNSDSYVLDLNLEAEMMSGERLLEFTGKPQDDDAAMNISAQRLRFDLLRGMYANELNFSDTAPQENEDPMVRQLREIQSLQDRLRKERELSALKECYTSLIAHDFGTPLTSIRSISDLLTKYMDRLPKEKIDKQLDRIQVQVNYMVTLLDDLVFVNRLHLQNEVYQPNFLNVKAFCQNLLDQPALRDEEHELVFTFDGEFEDALIDPRFLRYILSNLVTNAQKYSPADTEIRLDIHLTEQEVIVSVKDNGIGIPSSELDKICDPFYRASNAAQSSGMGLGLALVKASIEACGGTMMVESELGQGTTFIISLPFHKR